MWNQARRRDREREAWIPRARVGFREPCADRQDEIGGTAFLVRDRSAPEARHAEQERVILARNALAHQGVGNRDLERLRQLHELGGRACRQHAAARIQYRPFRGGEGFDNALRGCLVDRRSSDFCRHLAEGIDGQTGREDIHRHIHEHWSRAAGLGQVERAFDDPRQITGVVDSVDALAERAVDLKLIRILMKVDLLVRMAAMEVRLDVAGNHHQRDRVERGVGDAGRGIGETRSQMRQEDTWLSGRSRVAVRGVRGDLLMAGAHVADAAAPERIKHGDDRVSREAENDLHAEPLEVLRQQIRRDARFRRGRQRLRYGVDDRAHGRVSRVRRFPSCRTHRTTPVLTADLLQLAG